PLEQTPTSKLTQALQLVRDRPFAGTAPSDYTWAEPIIAEMIAQIVDVTDELAQRHLQDQQWTRVEWAVARGLACEPGMERLWRLRIRAAYAAGNADHLGEITARMLDLLDQLGGDLEPETT